MFDTTNGFKIMLIFSDEEDCHLTMTAQDKITIQREEHVPQRSFKIF